MDKKFASMYAKNKHMPFIETSAKTGLGVAEAFSMKEV